jgi:hypothetical protein
VHQSAGRLRFPGSISSVERSATWSDEYLMFENDPVDKKNSRFHVEQIYYSHDVYNETENRRRINLLIGEEHVADLAYHRTQKSAGDPKNHPTQPIRVCIDGVDYKKKRFRFIPLMNWLLSISGKGSDRLRW